MKLRRITIDRLPGIDDGFKVEDLGDGLHVIVGPNGIGKSSLCRAVRALLWSGPTAQQASVSASFDRDGELWLVERDFSRLRWQREGIEVDPPDLPSPHLEGCFFLGLRDLLDPKGEAGRGVAAEVRKQMSGGFDLREISEPLSTRLGPRWGRNEQRKVETAERSVRKAARKQEELGGKEDSLGILEAKRREGERARRQLPHVDQAIDLAQLRDGAAEVTEKLSDLPPELDKLTGRVLELLDELEGEIQKRRSELGQREDAKARAVGQLDSVPLAEPLPEGKFQTWRGRADSLAAVETELGTARDDHEAKQAAVAEATHAVGGHIDPVPDLDLPRAAELFAHLRKAQKVTSSIEALEQRIALLADRTFLDSDRRRAELLRGGVESLRSWSRAPDHEVPGGAARKPLAAVAGLLLVAGTLVVWLLHPLGWLAVGLGLGLALALVLLGTSSVSVAAQATAHREFPGGLEAPANWTVPSVSVRLREFESQLARLDAAEQRARDRQVEAASLKTQLVGERKDNATFEKRRAELTRHLGLETIPPEAELVDMVRAVDELRKARSAESEVAKRVASLQSRYGEALGELSQELVAHGAQKQVDATSVRAAVDTLRDWDERLRSAQQNKANAERELKRLAEEIMRLEGRVAKVFAEAGVEDGDRPGLVRRLDSLELYQTLRTERDSLNGSMDLGQRRLAKAGQESLASLDTEALAKTRAGLEELADQLEATQNKIAIIQAEVRHTREGHELENMLAARLGALHMLRAKRDEALIAAAGKFLIEEAQAEQEHSQMPDVLARARELFAGFTHHNWQLRVAAEDDATFFAVEAATGQGRNLEELSDGTRAQLLMAARLAFVQEAERGSRLPLFLDEALDQSDPARFHAIVRSLGRIAQDDDRQIFYLTSDPTDVQRFTAALVDEGCAPPRVIDLAEIRGHESVARAAELEVELPHEVPSPGDSTPEAYAEILGVSHLDPCRSHLSQHLFHVTWDDLALLHRLVAAGISKVGQWWFLRTSGSARCTAIAKSSTVGEQLETRIELLEIFTRLWREGRGRPVDREVLEASGVVSERFLDSVVEMAAELDGDAENLLRTLRERNDGRLRGFRSSVVDRLEEFFEEQGYLDPNPILEEADLIVRTQAAPAANRLSNEVVRNCLHRWWRLADRNRVLNTASALRRVNCPENKNVF